MRENLRYDRVYLILNIALAFIMFSNIAIYKRGVEPYLIFIVLSYFGVVILTNILQSRFFKMDNTINLIINLFLLISLVMLYRINETIGVRQCIFMLIGYVIYLSILFLVKDVHKFYKLKWVYFFLSLTFMSMSYLFGVYINGSKNWVDLFGVTFQPSEFGKIFFILYLSCVLKDSRSRGDKYMTIFLLITIFLFLILQKDLGSAGIIFILSMLMYYIKTSKYKFLILIIFSLAIAGGLAYINFPHVRVRIHAWLNPEADPMGVSYQVLQGFFAMGSGGFLGRGLYGGDLEFIPVNYTDYIFVSIVEELGIITGIFIVILYLILVIKIINKVLDMNKHFRSSICVVGFIMLISTQALIILGGTLNLIPLTGVTLPFISYGGSSLISFFIMFSIMQKMLEGECDIE